MALPILAPMGSKLEDRVKALEAAIMQVAQTANGALQIGPNQKSPVPGELIAGRITTPLPSGQPSMTLDLIRSGAGLGPILNVNDGAYNRASMGNLASYTGPNGIVSPAQYGFRAVDASGNAIFDSLGLIAVMSQIGSNSQPSGPLTGVPGPPTGISGTGGEVTLATMTLTIPAGRNRNVYLVAMGSNFVSCTAVHATAHPINFQIDGTDDATAYGFTPVYASAVEVQRTASCAFSLIHSFAPGAHTVKMIWNSQEDVSDTLFNAINSQWAFLMGS
jgi:hypothetical protein